MVVRLLVMAALLGGWLTPPAAAQLQSPKAAASQFLDAWNARDWSRAAQALDLSQFERFRRDFISRARQSANESPEMSVDDLRKMDPDMPREVAEYQVRRMQEQRRRFADPTPFEFARVSSLSALRALSVEEAAARWLESRDPRWQVKMQFEQAGCPAPGDLEDVPLPNRRLIGVVADGDSAAFAVFREAHPDNGEAGWSGGDVFVIELAQRPGRWVVVPKADLVPEVGQVDVSSCRGTPPR